MLPPMKLLENDRDPIRIDRRDWFAQLEHAFVRPPDLRMNRPISQRIAVHGPLDAETILVEICCWRAQRNRVLARLSRVEFEFRKMKVTVDRPARTARW